MLGIHVDAYSTLPAVYFGLKSHLHLSRETGETAPKSAALYRTGAATGQGMAEPWRGPFDESDNDWIVHLFW